MKKSILFIGCFIWSLLPMFGQTKVDLKTQTKPPGSDGQLLFNNAGVTDAEDPIVSYNYVNLLTTASATGTVSSASPVRVSTFGAFGTLYITFASITGSPSGCTLQIKNSDSLGNLINNGSTISVTPSNGTTSVAFNSGANLQTTARMSVTLACSVYPSTGTISVDYVPGHGVGILAPLPAGTNVIGHFIADSGSTTAITGNVAVTKADGSDVTLGSKADAKNTATDTTAITIMQVLKEISAMEQAPASRAVTNAGTFEVQPDGTTATTTNAASRCVLVSAASTNATNCKGSAGNVYGFRFVNTTTTVYYLRMYNSSSSPTCSSATGFIESIPIPPAASSGQAGGIVSIEPMGEGYSTGISFCFTGGSSSTDNTNAATGVFGTILYR